MNKKYFFINDFKPHYNNSNNSTKASKTQRCYSLLTVLSIFCPKCNSPLSYCVFDFAIFMAHCVYRVCVHKGAEFHQMKECALVI